MASPLRDPFIAAGPCRDIAAALGLLGGVLVCASGLLVRLTGPLMCLRGLELRLLGGVDGAGCALGRRVNAVVRTPASFSELGCAICGSVPSLPCVPWSRRAHLARSLRVTWTSVHRFSWSQTLDLDQLNARRVNVDADGGRCSLQSPGPLALAEAFTRPPRAVLFADAHWLPGMKLTITVRVFTFENKPDVTDTRPVVRPTSSAVGTFGKALGNGMPIAAIAGPELPRTLKRIHLLLIAYTRPVPSQAVQDRAVAAADP